MSAGIADCSRSHRPVSDGHAEMSFQLVQSYAVCPPVALRAEEPLERQDAHAVRLGVVQRHEPRVFTEPLQVFLGQMDFHHVSGAVDAEGDVESNQRVECVVEGGVERSAGFFAEHASEIATVDVYNAGIDMSVEDVPAETEKDLKPDQSESVVGTDGGGLLEGASHVARSDCPVADADGRVERLNGASGVPFGMAVVTERDGFTPVVLVHDGCVGKDVFFVPVEFPQSEDDMVEVDEMVTLECFLAAAPEACGRLVASNPFRVHDRSSNLAFKFPYWSVCAHASLYARDLHLRKAGFTLTFERWKRGVYWGFCGGPEGIDIIGDV